MSTVHFDLTTKYTIIAKKNAIFFVIGAIHVALKYIVTVLLNTRELDLGQFFGFGGFYSRKDREIDLDDFGQSKMKKKYLNSLKKKLANLFV